MSNKTSIFIAAFIGAIIYSAVLILICYRAYTGSAFNLFFLLDSLSEALITLVKEINNLVLMLTFIAILFSGIVYFQCLQILVRTVHALPFHFRLYSLFPVIISFFVWGVNANLPYSTELFFMENIFSTAKARNFDFSHFPLGDNSVDIIDSQENVIIVQLESVNSILLNGLYQYENSGKGWMPQLKAIAKDGVYIPYFWSNAIQTHRAQASILCGVAGNIGVPYANRIGDISIECLPSVLQQNNYSTVYLKNGKDPNFQNASQFMHYIGMQDVLVGNMMTPEDQYYKWGYDDKEFYRRAFGYLKKNYPNKNKIFAYFQVAMHHTPFEGLPGYNLHFDPQKNFLERYINSALAQDEALGVFYQEYIRFAPNNTHLIILADTSWPVGINGNTFNENGAHAENFIVPFVYIPPRNRAAEFAHDKTIPFSNLSQADIPSTILSLLGSSDHQNSGNSFEDILRNDMRKKKYKYESCQILTQPYDGTQIAVVQKDKKYTYDVTKKTVYYADLSVDFLEKTRSVIEENLNITDFIDKYYCDRYRNSQIVQHRSVRIPSGDIIVENIKTKNQLSKTAIIQSIDYEGGAITIEAQLLPKSSKASTIAGNFQHSGIGIVIDNNKWNFRLHNGTEYVSVTSDEPVIIGKQVHVAGIFDGSNIKLFVNGKLQKDTAQIESVRKSPYPWIIGGDPNQGGMPEHIFEGEILQIHVVKDAVFHVDFSQSERFKIRKESIGMWALQENLGTRTLNNTVTSQIDGLIL